MYANEDYTYDLSEQGYSDVFVDFEEEDCYFFYHGVLRYHLTNYRVFNAYAEAHAGFSSYFSDRRAGNISSNDPDISRLDVLKDKIIFHGTAFNTGIGGGITADVGSLFKRENALGVLIDFGIRLNTGSRALYRSMESSVTVVNSEDGFYRSTTNSVFYKLGVILSLSR